MAQAILFTDKKQAVLGEIPIPEQAAPGHVLGRTLYSLISPGTELQYYLREHSIPTQSGYAAVFQIEKIGEGVTSCRVGDVAFCMGSHKSYQHVACEEVVLIPDHLDPSIAILTRLMNIGMTALMTTRALPGSKVLVTGAGPVGLLAALVFQRNGYEVFISDPVESRFRAALEAGVRQGAASLPIEDVEWYGNTSLLLECSGHEAAVLSGCDLLRKGGEAVLAGVPWQQTVDLSAHQLLSLIFHRYILLRSGWEWELPRFTQDFLPASTQANFQLGIQWLSEGLLDPHPYTKIISPIEANNTYAGLADRSIKELFVIFDWNICKEAHI